ncbi:MAG: TerB family tellurite resistance protein [Deltaproteobacteria bacterium]|nr:TerB family tellurite resistance protein [Deltaproteobacteria bacterium]
MNKAPSILQNTVNNIFQNNEKLLQRQGSANTSRPSIAKKDMELALTVLLVDLAGCDQSFDIQEYNIIQNGLRRVFGTTKSEVTALINQANLTLKNLRGSGRFANLLKDSLDQAQREVIMEVIEDVIAADGVEDGFETYLRHKFADLLGVSLKAPESPEKTA